MGEPERLEDADLGYALAHHLAHGVAGHQQDGEEHRAENRHQDGADVADLLGEALQERELGLRLDFAAELANSASIACASSAERSGSPTRTVNHPTLPLACSTRASSK